MNSKKILKISVILMVIAVILGAFGAHGIKNRVTPALLGTWKTGVLYLYIHSIAIFCLGLTSYVNKNFQPLKVLLAFMFGIVLFSGNCILYVLTDYKPFVHFVPVGGLMFIVAWVLFYFEINNSFKESDNN
jgi:uncharacterized membrane protein YgdD (TMEM256/DUF423 family)